MSLAVTDEETADLSGTRLSISNSLTSVHKCSEEQDEEKLEVGRVASWAVGFEKLLNDDMGLSIFTDFLKKEFSQENIEFWIECEKFKKLSDLDVIRQKAGSIWSTYLSDADDGSCPINIDSRTRQECQSLLKTPNVNMFEKAQSQIFQLMKYDSYTRFLKSNMYKDCIMSEMEGKSLPHHHTSGRGDNEERSKTIDCLIKLKDEEKKDKKRSPLLPWTKVKRDREPINEKEKTPTSTTSLQTPTFKIDNKIKPSASSLTAITINNNNNNNNNSNNSIVDFSLSSSSVRSDINHDPSLLSSNLTGAASQLLIRRGSANTLTLDTTKKNSVSDSFTVDSSRFCRFLFPDSTSAIILSSNCNHITIQQAINRLFAKRGITWYRTELYVSNSDQLVDVQETLSTLCGKEVRVESRVLCRLDLPSRSLCIRCDPKRTLLQILQPILDKLKLSIAQFVYYINDSLIPLNLNENISGYDNQRIYTLTKTASGVDMSARTRLKSTNDIFEMIPDNDEDIRFDETGVLKTLKQQPLQRHSPSIVMNNDDHSPTPEKQLESVSLDNDRAQRKQSETVSNPITTKYYSQKQILNANLLNRVKRGQIKNNKQPFISQSTTIKSALKQRQDAVPETVPIDMENVKDLNEPDLGLGGDSNNYFDLPFSIGDRHSAIPVQNEIYVLSPQTTTYTRKNKSTQTQKVSAEKIFFDPEPVPISPQIVDDLTTLAAFFYSIILFGIVFTCLTCCTHFDAPCSSFFLTIVQTFTGLPEPVLRSVLLVGSCFKYLEKTATFQKVHQFNKWITHSIGRGARFLWSFVRKNICEKYCTSCFNTELEVSDAKQLLARRPLKTVKKSTEQLNKKTSNSNVTRAQATRKDEKDCIDKIDEILTETNEDDNDIVEDAAEESPSAGRSLVINIFSPKPSPTSRKK
ncbi:unnamed protein product [Didymodactylos carnosus]|uniref:RGS domain-containing protein n=1 Tax=Didymodactylos carnosus TaxID=1234261 RepID=A0A8S2HJD3_9BILA|nr:unnamed protein product [Didymodactylos carnosus]CAF3655845.1 unnamed protein product [Didymodactylos carnosus]